jgi:hypothetical protein
MKFENFYTDMGERPVGHELSRIDNDGDYEPGNVVWELKLKNLADRNERGKWKTRGYGLGAEERRGQVRSYHSWNSMRSQCNNPNDPKYYCYGGCGIIVHPRWDSFDDFYADMGARPVNMVLGRIDKSGNFELDNCRWMTPKERSANQRPQRRRDICKNGHKFAEVGVYERQSGKYFVRQCKQCALDRANARHIAMTPEQKLADNERRNVNRRKRMAARCERSE